MLCSIIDIVPLQDTAVWKDAAVLKAIPANACLILHLRFLT